MQNTIVWLAVTVALTVGYIAGSTAHKSDYQAGWNACQEQF